MEQKNNRRSFLDNKNPKLDLPRLTDIDTNRLAKKITINPLGNIPNEVLKEQQENMDRFVKSMKQKREQEEREKRESVQREVDMVNYLKNINENTAGITELVNVMRQNNEINEEALELHKEMLDIIKSQTVEEAKSIFRKVISKANETKAAVDTILWLTKYGRALINIVFKNSE